MIRREETAADGSRRWTLITQTEHARLAGDLARHWGADPFWPVVPSKVMLPAIYRHDDGWRNWDQSPRVDPDAGRPFAFDEIARSDADKIWTQSIGVCEDLGPLAQYLIALHFVQLRRRSQVTDTDTFVQKFAPQAATWLETWKSLRPRAHTDSMATTALAHLQLFDRLSLWFCCGRPARPLVQDTPGGAQITLTPSGETGVQLHPWPLTVPTWKLDVSGRSIPVRQYTDSRQLQTVQSEFVSYRWELVPR